MSTVRIVPYEDIHVPAVAEFNRRIAHDEEGFQFPEHKNSRELPRTQDREIFQEYFVAFQEPYVRGGYILKSQPCALLGQAVTIGNYQLPLSEGIVDKAHGMVGVQLLLDALRKQPKLYSLGMGGIHRALPQMLKKTGWKVELVPFFSKVVKGGAFLRNISFLRSKPKLKVAAELLFWSGLGTVASAGTRLLASLARHARLTAIGTIAVVAPEFETWADDIWHESNSHYQLIGGRNLATLKILYPRESKRFTRLQVRNGEKTVGWALLLNTKMSGHKQFGNMRVGTIADCLSIPGYEQAVIDHATDWLEKAGAELLVSNQSHKSWVRALRTASFFSGPPNYGFAGSAALMKGITSLSECHINRGDGDGPINI